MSLAFPHALPGWAVLAILGMHLGAGIILGALYFRTLWWTTQRFGSDGRVPTAIALMGGRFVLLGGMLFLVGLEGAAPLLSMMLGILMARFVVLRRVQAAAP